MARREKKIEADRSSQDQGVLSPNKPWRKKNSHVTLDTIQALFFRAIQIRTWFHQKVPAKQPHLPCHLQAVCKRTKWYTISTTSSGLSNDASAGIKRLSSKEKKSNAIPTTETICWRRIAESECQTARDIRQKWNLSLTITFFQCPMPQSFSFVQLLRITTHRFSNLKVDSPYNQAKEPSSIQSMISAWCSPVTHTWGNSGIWELEFVWLLEMLFRGIKSPYLVVWWLLRSIGL